MLTNVGGIADLTHSLWWNNSKAQNYLPKCTCSARMTMCYFVLQRAQRFAKRFALYLAKAMVLGVALRLSQRRSLSMREQALQKQVRGGFCCKSANVYPKRWHFIS